MNKKEFFIPPRGYIAELVKLTGYHRDTVSDALHKNSKGRKAERVRMLYQAKYLKEESDPQETTNAEPG